METLKVQGAFNWISWSPEKRESEAKKAYDAQCASIIEELGDNEQSQYIITVLTKLLNDYYASLGNTASCWVTGRSGFNVARNQKRQQWAQNKWDKVNVVIPKMIARAKRRLGLTRRGIFIGDNDAVTQLKQKVENLEMHIKLMKEANKFIKKHDNIEAFVANFPCFEKLAYELHNPTHSYQRKGFQSWTITNASARLRDAKKRLAKAERMHNTETTTVEIKNGRAEIVYAENRVRLYFNDIPSKEIRQELVSKGFKWARSIGAWSAYINYNSERAIEWLKN